MRIIPARAGFTPLHHVTVITHQDHPRSRGVYELIDLPCSEMAGSSPLARGLQRLGMGRDLIPRIIPARAGFTIPGVSTQFTAQDHPRSRGVYA